MKLQSNLSFCFQPHQKISGTTQDVPQNIPESDPALPSQLILTPGKVKIARPQPTETIPEPGNLPVENINTDSDSAKPDIAITDVASVESQLGATVAESLNDQSVERDVTNNVKPVENEEVPFVPEDLKQAPDKEDTAIRLEDKPAEPPAEQTDKETAVLPDEQSQATPTPSAVTEIVRAEPQKSDKAAETVVESGDNDKSAPMPSGKAVIEGSQPELKGDMSLPESLPTKEPAQPEPVITGPAVATVVGDSLPEITKPQQQIEKSQVVHAAVNGVSPDLSLDTEAPRETKQDDAASVKVGEIFFPTVECHWLDIFCLNPQKFFLRNCFIHVLVAQFFYTNAAVTSVI